MTTRLLILLCSLLFARSLSAAPYKPQCRGADGKLVQCSGTLDNAQAPTAIAASTLTGIVAQANGGTGTDTSALANGVLVKSAGSVTTSTAPTMSGANLTSGTVPPASIQGSASGRVLVDTGTTGAFTNTPVGLTLSGASNTFANIPAATALSGQVPVANGGTNKASWTVGSIPVATAGTTIGEIAPGTANHVLTSNGTGAAPTMQALPTASSGTSTLGSAFALTSTDTYQDTGLSVSLPSSGTYLLAAQVKATLLATDAAPYATCRLYNVTAGAVLANSELFVAFAPAAGTYGINTATAQKTYTLAAASTIRLECARRQATVWSVSEISSDVDGRTAVTYVKLAS